MGAQGVSGLGGGADAYLRSAPSVSAALRMAVVLPCGGSSVCAGQEMEQGPGVIVSVPYNSAD